MGEFIHPVSTKHVDMEFKKFKIKHGKIYENKKAEVARKELFRQNLRFIHSSNRQNKTYSLSVNHLADKSDLEIKALRGKKYSGVPNDGAPFPYNHVGKNDFPSAMDWRLFGAVTPVKGNL